MNDERQQDSRDRTRAEPRQDDPRRDPKSADNPDSTGGPEAIEEALERPGHDTPRRAPSTTSQRLTRDEFPDAGEGQG